jgi:hypothetical protein
MGISFDIGGFEPQPVGYNGVEPTELLHLIFSVRFRKGLQKIYFKVMRTGESSKYRISSSTIWKIGRCRNRLSDRFYSGIGKHRFL